MKMLISVIIPVFNTEKYLDRCLNSIINNSYRNIEILCINNGSTDNSLSILRRFQKKDKRVKIFDEKVKNVSHARNVGLDHAKGTAICFVDSDDYIPSFYFKALESVLTENNADLVICDMKKVTENDNSEELLGKVITKKIGLNSILNHHLLRTRVWGRIYRRDLIGDKRFPEDIGHGEDSIFNLLIFTNSLKCFYIKKKMYYYCQRKDSIVHTLTTKEKLSKCNWVLKHIDDIENTNCRKLLLEECCKSVLNNRYLCRFKEDTVERTKECSEICKRVKPLLKNNNSIPIIKRLLYIIFLQKPSIYRLFRMISDPSMIKWEIKHYKELKAQSQSKY